jgi:hypothetical protein
VNIELMKKSKLTQKNKLITVIIKSYISFDEKKELENIICNIVESTNILIICIFKLKLCIIICPNQTEKLQLNQ